MKHLYKFSKTSLTDKFEFKIPEPLSIRSVKLGDPPIFLSFKAVVDITEPLGIQRIGIYQVGKVIPRPLPNWEYLATVNHHGKVWHIFDEGWVELGV